MIGLIQAQKWTYLKPLRPVGGVCLRILQKKKMRRRRKGENCGEGLYGTRNFVTARQSTTIVHKLYFIISKFNKKVVFSIYK